CGQSQNRPKQVVNLDTGAIINATQLDDIWANIGMRLYLSDKTPKVTYSAVDELFNGTNGKPSALDHAGPLEKALVVVFLSSIDIVRDNPSSRVLNIVPNSNRSAKALRNPNDRVIFGTGDQNGWKTITVDGAFVRAAMNSGVLLDAAVYDMASYAG